MPRHHGSKNLDLNGLPVSQGLGPELMVVPGKLRRGKYRIGVQDLRAGPTGVVRGSVVVQRFRGGEKPELPVIRRSRTC